MKPLKALLVCGISGLAVLILSWFALMAAGSWPQPYGSEMRALSWHLDWQDRAYNVAVVVPGRLYRSAQPDERLIEYLHERYGIGRITTLNGRREHRYHAHARALGIEVHRFAWTSKRVPPDAELREVLGLIRGSTQPVLVHCAAGKDRTGYAIASYRMLEQDWPLEETLEEMRQHWHNETKRPWFFAALRERG